MTRVLEFVVALIIVFILAVIVGVFLPNHAHIERSIEISHNPRQMYDVLNNFRRFQDYAGGQLQIEDPGVKFSLSGPAYGPGATISWQGDAKLGNGKLVNKSGTIDLSGSSTVTWDLTNNWRGENKVFTLQVEPSSTQRVSKITWGYDEDYGWNLIDRYSQMWIHGKPATLIQYGLDSLQNMVAAIPNVDYSGYNPGLYQTQATPMLLVSTSASRTLDDINSAKADAMKQIQDAMKELGVKQAGPTTTFTTQWGDTSYKFDVAVPIDATTLTIDKKEYDLTKLPPRPTVREMAEKYGAEVAAAQSAAAAAQSAASAASAGGPASASSTAATATASAEAKPEPGTLNHYNQLIVNDNVRAFMMPEREVLASTQTGQAGILLARLALHAYADTHGYDYDENDDRFYDQLTSLPTVADQLKVYRVYQPVHNAPEQTPEQIDGRTKPFEALDPALWGGESPDAEKDAAKK